MPDAAATAKMLEQVGVTFDLDHDDIVTDVVVLARAEKLHRPGESVLAVGTSQGLDFFTQYGLVTAAAAQIHEEGRPDA